MWNLTNLKTLLVMAVLLFTGTGIAQAETVKVMTFNIWVGGGDSLSQTITECQNSGADIIGMQEAGGGSFEAIAAALGFYSDYGTYTLSRWPITQIQGYGYGQAVTICTPTGQEVYMFNCHLTAYPYGPYQLPDVNKALNDENNTQWPDLNPILSNMSSYIATGQPVFLTGDFNVPSHLDYDGVAWKCSTEAANDGLMDSYWEINGPPGGRTWPPDWDYDDSGITWTAKPQQEPNDKFDRIDIVYYAGTGVSATASTELDGPNWPSDHRAVISTFTIPDGSGGDCGGGLPQPTLTLNKSNYEPGEAVVATFSDGPGNAADWIGIYEDGNIPDGNPASTVWYYTNGTQTAGGSATDASVTFTTGAAPTWPLPEGDYDAFFLCCDAYGILDGPIPFTVSVFSPADFDTDFDVDADDCNILAAAWLSINGQPAWNAVCDISEPFDRIDMQDFAAFCAEWQ